MKKQVLVLFWTIVAAVAAHAQSIGPSTLNAAGGGGNISGNSFDYSIGEMTVVSTYTSPSLVVTQGVLQPPDGPSAVVIEDLPGLNVYPNPASTVVNISYQATVSSKLTYTLLDMSGKTITRNTQDVDPGNFATQVSVSQLPAATYMLQVILQDGNNTRTSSYKIQKLQ